VPPLATSTPAISKTSIVKARDDNDEEDEEVFKKPLERNNQKLLFDEQIKKSPKTYSLKNHQPDHFDKVVSKPDTSNSAVQSVPEIFVKATQTEEISEDLYTRLSQLCRFLCAEKGVEGNILVQGVGNIEIKLSRPPVEKVIQSDVSTQTKMDVKQVGCTAKVPTKSTGTGIKMEMVHKSVNTDVKKLNHTDSQTELDHFVGIEADVRIELEGLSQVSDTPIGSNNNDEAILIKETQTPGPNANERDSQLVDSATVPESFNLESVLEEMGDESEDATDLALSRIDFDTQPEDSIGGDTHARVSANRGEEHDPINTVMTVNGG